MRLGVSRRSIYQMTTPIGKARDEGNCVGAIRGGEEACEDVRKHRVCRGRFGCSSPPGLLHVQSARLRTETSYKAGRVGRVSTTSRSRSQLTHQVKGELVQRKFMSLSGETCQATCESSFAPASTQLRRKCGNVTEKPGAGEAGVSRGRSTVSRHPVETGRTEQ